MESPVLKPGGFWICPACGQRNKVWAPCSGCGTALAGMAHPEQRLASGAAADGPTPRVARTSWILYALGAAGVVAAVVLGVAMSRLLGGANLTGQEDFVEAGVRAAASPEAAPPRAEPLRSAVPVAPAPPPAPLPMTPPPAALAAPSPPAEAPGYSIPAPSRPVERLPAVADERRSRAELRARQQAVRSARTRFERAEEELAAAEGGDPEREAEAMEELEDAARALREAETALDRARRRRQP